MDESRDQGRDDVRPGRVHRCESFVLNAVALEHGPMLTMPPLARAYFARLVLRAWLLDEPGVIRDDDEVLCALCEATPEHWAEVGRHIRAALVGSLRPGWLVCRVVADAHVAQTEYLRDRRERGRAGGLASAQARNDKRAKRMNRRSSAAQAQLDRTSSEPQAKRSGSGFGSGSGSGESEDEKRRRRGRDAGAAAPRATAPTRPTHTATTPMGTGPGERRFWAENGERRTDAERDPAAEAAFRVVLDGEPDSTSAVGWDERRAAVQTRVATSEARETRKV